ncbi:MAG: glycosyltransferase N-terminal domain-containing protein [Bacteroidota bacterium]
MSILIYTIILRFYLLAIHIAAFFSTKAKQWITGRSETHKRIKQHEFSAYKNCIWVHASSLGEFEQARPIIERIKKENPNQQIVVSFFSPSGYEFRKNYPLADAVIYLPFDTSSDIKLFIDQLEPSIVCWIRYEFWFNTLNYIHQKNIPLYLISGSFRANQLFFKWYGRFYVSILKLFTTLFIINHASIDLLKKIGITNVELAADTRMDRVIEIASSNTLPTQLTAFLQDRKCVLVAGSTWQADIDILHPFINKQTEAVCIIAPHQIEEVHLQYIESKLTIPNIRFSQLGKKGSSFENIIIIDNMGMLASLYRVGKYAYVGGGFGTSVHNVLEAIVYHQPVLFGPHHQKQYECGVLIAQEIATVVYTSKEIEDRIAEFETNHTAYEKTCAAAAQYVQSNSGGSDIIFRHIQNRMKK